MSHFAKTHWPFLLRLSNLIKCISQLNYFNQIDWSKHTCCRSIVKMDMSITKKRPINQLELFEKPFFLVVFFVSLSFYFF
jgi:hypothetical protein